MMTSDRWFVDAAASRSAWRLSEVPPGTEAVRGAGRRHDPAFRDSRAASSVQDRDLSARASESRLIRTDGYSASSVFMGSIKIVRTTLLLIGLALNRSCGHQQQRPVPGAEVECGVSAARPRVAPSTFMLLHLWATARAVVRGRPPLSTRWCCPRVPAGRARGSRMGRAAGPATEVTVCSGGARCRRWSRAPASKAGPLRWQKETTEWGTSVMQGADAL